MCHLLETIRIEDGKALRLDWHNARLNRSRAALWDAPAPLDLADWVRVPPFLKEGTYKCRVICGPDPERVEFHPYRPKKVSSLKLVRADALDYAHKYEDREVLHELLRRRGSCDDILIVKHGQLTDTSYSNIALYDGTHWVTPAHPLLAGTRRAQLLAEGVLRERALTPDDLKYFRSLRLLNAMLDWDTQMPIPLDKVVE